MKRVAAARKKRNAQIKGQTFYTGSTDLPPIIQSSF